MVIEISQPSHRLSTLRRPTVASPLILDTDTDTTASFVSHSGTGGIGHGHSLYSSFGSIKGHGMSRLAHFDFVS